MDDFGESRINKLSSLIGNTPLLAIRFKLNGKVRTIYAKAENLNMTGSIKDRMAYHMLKRGYKSGSLKPGNLIIEATSGNTGIAFSALGRALGHPVTIFMPNWLSEERINLIKSLGATINLVSKEEGGFLGSIKLSEELAKNTESAFLPRQFSNNDNSEAHYLSTAREIWYQLKFHSISPDAFIAGVGTGGTVMGVSRYFKEKDPLIKIYPLEPAESPTLTTGYKVGKHRIQGISDEFIPAIVELDKLDEIIEVNDGDAIIMSQKLSTELGIGVGISSGANFIGAVKIQNEIGEDANVVTVFPDDNKKYLSTDLLKTEPVRDNYLSQYIDLLDFQSFKRACYTCCDPSECLEIRPQKKEELFTLPHCPRRVKC